MNTDEQPSKPQPPYVIAVIASMASLAIVHLVFKSAIAWLEVWWAELFVYALIPISVIFFILYRSCWHRELTGALRTLSLVGLSSIIFAAVLLGGGFFLMVLFAVFNGITRIY
jgi:hypothetical protein